MLASKITQKITSLQRSSIKSAAARDVITLINKNSCQHCKIFTMVQGVCINTIFSWGISWVARIYIIHSSWEMYCIPNRGQTKALVRR